MSSRPRRRIASTAPPTKAATSARTSDTGVRMPSPREHREELARGASGWLAQRGLELRRERLGLLRPEHGGERSGAADADEDAPLQVDLLRPVLGGRGRPGGPEGARDRLLVRERQRDLGDRVVEERGKEEAGARCLLIDAARADERLDHPCTGVERGEASPGGVPRAPRDELGACLLRADLLEAMLEPPAELVPSAQPARHASAADRHRVDVEVVEELGGAEPAPPEPGIHHLHEPAQAAPDDDEVGRAVRVSPHEERRQRVPSRGGGGDRAGASPAPHRARA